MSSIISREEPKIGGTSAGFIAVIVCLVIVILCSSVAILFVVRKDQRSDLERTKRSLYEPKKSFAKKGRSFLSVIGNLFSKKGRSSSKGVKSSSGWVQAASGDEWDSDDEVPYSRRSMSGNPRPNFFPLPSRNPEDPPFRPPASNDMPSMSSVDSRASIRFDLPSPMPSGPHDNAVHTTLPSSPSSPTSPRVEIPLSTRTRSPEPLSGIPGDSPEEEAGRKNSKSSTIRTFSGGTKFIEDI